MKVVIAPNAFKHSLTAQEAASAIKQGFTESGISCDCITFPIGDGGDGTGKLLREILQAREIRVTVKDPLYRDIECVWGYDEANRVAIIEMADASGIRLVTHDERDPMRATSFGTGQLIEDAILKGCSKIILCIGGTATVDGGSGLLEALGAVYTLSKQRMSVPLTPLDMPDLTGADFTSVRKKFNTVSLDILCDVKNPLIGPNGAVRTFAPQKGALENDLLNLEHSIAIWCDILRKATGRDVGNLMHGGAAGGVSASLHAVVNARLVNGIEYFLATARFDAVVSQCDVVITGEGRLDEQTLDGKGPYGVAVAAKRFGKKVIGIGGSVSENRDQMGKFFDALIPITPDGQDLNTALKNARQNLIRSSKVLALSLAASNT